MNLLLLVSALAATNHFCLRHHTQMVVAKTRSDTIKVVLGGAMRTTIQDVRCPKFACQYFTETNQTWVTEKELPKILKGMK